jgi:stage II sporulation protein R
MLSVGSKIKKLRTVLMITAFALIMNLAVSAAHRTLLQQGIAEEVLRFHVLANSDSETDQEIKYKVRDAVLAWMQEQETAGEITKEMSDAAQQENSEETTERSGDMTEATASGKEQTESFLAAHLADIERVADEVLEGEGVPYRATAALEDCYFPDRTYGACTFPAGWYRALRLRLGEAEGHNWWCVLYPGLCFSDCLHAVVEEDGMAELKEVLSAEEYEALLRDPKQWKISFRWF